MKKVIAGIFCLGVITLGFSQTIGGYDMGSGITGQVTSFGTKASDRGVVNGTPYFSEVFLPAKISSYEDENLLLRYNAAEDEMEFERQKETYYVPKGQELSIRFTSSGKEYKYLSYSDKGNQHSGYLVVVSEDNIGLYKREQIKFVAGREAANSYDIARPAEYKKADDTFFIKNGESIVNFPKNRKELLNMFPEQKTQITDYIKKNKISFSKETDLVELTKFLNRL